MTGVKDPDALAREMEFETGTFRAAVCMSALCQ